MENACINTRVSFLKVSSLFSELHRLTVWLAKKCLTKPSVPEVMEGEVLSEQSLDKLSRALEDPNCLLSPQMIDLGTKAETLLGKVNIPPAVLADLQSRYYTHTRF